MLSFDEFSNILHFFIYRNELKWDDDDVYVIGGLVDVDIKSNASLGTIHILRNQFEGKGGFIKSQFLSSFCT